MSYFTKSRRASRAAVIALVASAIVATFLGTLQVKRHHELVRLSYELSDVTDELRTADEENRRLRLERSLLTAPARIEPMAADIGMVHPRPDQLRSVGPRELATR